MQKAAVALLLASVSAQPAARLNSANDRLITDSNRVPDLRLGLTRLNFGDNAVATGQGAVASGQLDSRLVPSVKGNLLPNAPNKQFDLASGSIDSKSRFHTGDAHATGKFNHLQDDTVGTGTTYTLANGGTAYKSPFDGSSASTTGSTPQVHLSEDIRQIGGNLGSFTVDSTDKNGKASNSRVTGAGYSGGKSWLLKSTGEAKAAHTSVKNTGTNVGVIDWNARSGALLTQGGQIQNTKERTYASGLAKIGTGSAAGTGSIAEASLTQINTGAPQDKASLVLGKVTNARDGDATLISAELKDRENHESTLKVTTDDFRPQVVLPDELATPNFSETVVAVPVTAVGVATNTDALNPLSYGATLLTGTKP